MSIGDLRLFLKNALDFGYYIGVREANFCPGVQIILTWFNMLCIALAIVGMGLWWNGMRAKELAVKHGRDACKKANVQLLDQTVALHRMKMSRANSGSLCLRRVYRFEFTQSGTHRDSGTVTMNGHTLEQVFLPYLRDENGNRIFLH